MQQPVANILKQYHLSVTESRKKILGLFIRQEGALTHADIEKKAGRFFDRVTIYRTLQAFLEKGLIHTIPSADGVVKYALCRNECDEHGHHDNHVHFVCKRCGKTICLDNTNVPPVKLPSGFVSSHVEVLVSGSCAECR